MESINTDRILAQFQQKTNLQSTLLKIRQMIKINK